MGEGLSLLLLSAWLSGWCFGIATCLAVVLVLRLLPSKAIHPRHKENDHG